MWLGPFKATCQMVLYTAASLCVAPLLPCYQQVVQSTGSQCQHAMCQPAASTSDPTTHSFTNPVCTLHLTTQHHACFISSSQLVRYGGLSQSRCHSMRLVAVPDHHWPVTLQLCQPTDMFSLERLLGTLPADSHTWCLEQTTHTDVRTTATTLDNKQPASRQPCTALD